MNSCSSRLVNSEKLNVNVKRNRYFLSIFTLKSLKASRFKLRRILIIGIFISTILFFKFSIYSPNFTIEIWMLKKNPQNFNSTQVNLFENQNHNLELECLIPQLIPNSKLILKLNEQQLGQNVAPRCVNNQAAKFYIDLDSNLIRNFKSGQDKWSRKQNGFWHQAACFYQGFRRDVGKPDYEYIQDEIFEITANSTRLETQSEFISIWCFDKENLPSTFPLKNKMIIYEDHLLHIPLKSHLSPWTKFPPNPNPKPNPESPVLTKPPSIMVIGIDTMSRMNFLRYLPKSYKFLKEKMGAVDFNHFNSMGWETWDTFVPMLTGYSQRELRLHHCPWFPFRYYYLDNCPFIWKNFEAAGYVTSYYDEEFEGPRPFRSQPFHYDFRNFIRRLREETIIGHDIGKYFLRECFGSKLTFSVHLDLALKLAYRFKDKGPFFHFGWTQQLSHEINSHSQYGDEPLEGFLKEMEQRQLLDNTIVIVAGDHGMRYGKPRTMSGQGYFEERLPLLMMSLPKKFRQLYPEAIKNFEGNSNKFIIAPDFHSTLLDLMNPLQLTDDKINERTLEQNQNVRKDFEKTLGQGTSLFLSISPKRNCQLIPQFDMTFCACVNSFASQVVIDEDNNLYSSSNSNYERWDIFKLLGTTLIKQMNEKVAPHVQCTQFTLNEIIQVKLFKDFIDSNSRPRFKIKERLHWAKMEKIVRNLYQIEVKTKPNGSIFRGFAMQLDKEDKDDPVEWEIFSTSRISEEIGQGGKLEFNCDVGEELKEFCEC